MKFIHKIGGAITLGIIAAFAFATIHVSGVTYAADKKDDTKKTEATTTDTAYSFTANEGNSYTQLVRKAVQIYGIQEKKDIGNARIVAIETTVSADAGWPELTVGEKVSFKKSDVKAWVDKAMKLSAEDVAAWQTYVQYIDFDTRGIGE